MGGLFGRHGKATVSNGGLLLAGVFLIGTGLLWIAASKVPACRGVELQPGTICIDQGKVQTYEELDAEAKRGRFIFGPLSVVAGIAVIGWGVYRLTHPPVGAPPPARAPDEWPEAPVNPPR